MAEVGQEPSAPRAVRVCRICVDFLHNPAAAVEPCGHVFCHACIQPQAATDAAATCPTCQGPIGSIRVLEGQDNPAPVAPRRPRRRLHPFVARWRQRQQQEAQEDAAPGGGRRRRHCRQYTNRSCEECLKNVTCLWCASSRRCMEYPVRRILPPADLCELRSAHWGVCWVNFEALIIAMSVVGGTLLIMLGVCCCCCCCKKKSKKPDKDDERAAREREKRRVRQEERRAEMKSRHDEIRRKYGLFKEENPYAKFEN
ncbi:pituitary tumor-transforming gene 1 protein-interacting protein-like [Passer domesticus]|uniref:pituitary tumor-transforming gene 1 protein-interacting protein-like n=1 Tax=Passer domesticus TaxID=48849 RepID=UPI0030FE62C3